MRSWQRSSFTAAVVAAAASAASATDRVLILGAQADLVHEDVRSLSSFSPAGLAELAMDAFGLPTGAFFGETQQKTAFASQSPVQADVFTHVEAYAMIYVDKSDAAVLSALSTESGYQKAFDLSQDNANNQLPAVLAHELTQAFDATEIQCAGRAVFCKSNSLPLADLSDARVEEILASLAFLDGENDADAAFAVELAQAKQLAEQVAAKTTMDHALYVLGFSGVKALESAKQEDARHALAAQIESVLRALQDAYPRTSGAQVIAVTDATEAAVPVDATMAFSRMLAEVDEDESNGSNAGSSSESSGSSDAAADTTTSDIDIQDIANYQIILWTSVILVVALILVLMAMCNMEPKRDSLLYAKFTSSVSTRKLD